MCAPKIVVVSISHGGTGNCRASKPQIASTSAPSASARPTVTSTCSIVPLVERPDQHELDERREQRADREPDDRADEELRPGPPPTWVDVPQVGVGADGEEGAVREVEHAHQAVDQREAGRDQEVHRPEAEAR